MLVFPTTTTGPYQEKKIYKKGIVSETWVRIVGPMLYEELGSPFLSIYIS